MTKKVSAAEAKAHLSALMAQVAYGGERVVVERRGKPLAALVSMDDLQRLERLQPSSSGPQGALAMVGAWAGLMSDEEIDEFVEHVYRTRAEDLGRQVSFDDLGV